jgi:polar amino acid transport system substrate-binding protein
MRRALTGVLLTFLASVSSAGDLPEIESRGIVKLLLGQTPGRTADSTAGFDEEILEGWAKLNRLRVERVLIPSWDDLIPSLAGGKGDVIGGDFEVTEARRKRVAFTAEIFPVRNVVVSRRPSPEIRTLSQLRAAKVVTVAGTSLADDLSRAGLPAGNLVLADRRAVSEGMRTGTYTATLLPLSSAILAQRRDPDLQLGMFLGASSSYAFAVRPSDSALLTSLDAFVANYRKSGAWNRLVVKHYGPAALEILKLSRSE